MRLPPNIIRGKLENYEGFIRLNQFCPFAYQNIIEVCERLFAQQCFAQKSAAILVALHVHSKTVKEQEPIIYPVKIIYLLCFKKRNRNYNI